MKKSEELEKLCPPPKPSEIAGLSLTATTAMVSGRYIKPGAATSSSKSTSAARRTTAFSA